MLSVLSWASAQDGRNPETRRYRKKAKVFLAGETRLFAALRCTLFMVNFPRRNFSENRGESGVLLSANLQAS